MNKTDITPIVKVNVVPDSLRQLVENIVKSATKKAQKLRPTAPEKADQLLLEAGEFKGRFHKRPTEAVLFRMQGDKIDVSVLDQAPLGLSDGFSDSLNSIINDEIRVTFPLSAQELTKKMAKITGGAQVAAKA